MILGKPVLSTDIAPGYRANVRVVRLIDIEGKLHAIVATRETPDIIYALRNEGQLYPPIPDDGSPSGHQLVPGSFLPCGRSDQENGR